MRWDVRSALWSVVLALLGSNTGAAMEDDLKFDRWVRELQAIDAGDYWVRAHQFGPNLVYWFQPGVKKTEHDESYMAIQAWQMSTLSVQDMKRKLSMWSNAPKKIGRWTVDGVQKNGACYAINLRNEKEKRDQYWCFGKKYGFSVTQIGPARVPASQWKRIDEKLQKGTQLK